MREIDGLLEERGVQIRERLRFQGCKKDVEERKNEEVIEILSNNSKSSKKIGKKSLSP